MKDHIIQHVYERGFPRKLCPMRLQIVTSCTMCRHLESKDMCCDLIKAKHRVPEFRLCKSKKFTFMASGRALNKHYAIALPLLIKFVGREKLVGRKH